MGALCKSLGPEENKQFMVWLAKEVIVPELEAKESKLAGIPEDEEDCKKPSTCRIEGYQNLDRIASYLRDKLPVEATLPSECIRHPTSGLTVGSVFSLVLFKRRMWPITFGMGAGFGMGYNNCERDVNEPYMVHISKLKKVE